MKHSANHSYSFNDTGHRLAENYFYYYPGFKLLCSCFFLACYCISHQFTVCPLCPSFPSSANDWHYHFQCWASLSHGRFNALLRVTISLAHVTLNAGYFSPGTCIATSWTVFSTLLLLWPQPHFKRTGKTLSTLRKIACKASRWKS